MYWTRQAVQGNQVIRTRVRSLEESQFWEADKLREYQLRKLQNVVRHAYDAVPYYRELMDHRGLRPEQIRDFDDYRRLPILTRAALRARAPELVSRTAGVNLSYRYSSGSTGERVGFVQDRDFDRWCRAHQLRTYAWCGSWQLGESFALVWGSPTYFESRSRASKFDNLISNRIEVDAFRLDRTSLQRILGRLVREQPVLISGYTTALYLLARLAREGGLRFPMLRAVQPNAEPLNDLMRTEIERGFGCEIFDKYGSRETNIIAHEGVAHDGLRIQAEHTYVEFLGADGDLCPPGELGRLVVSTLNNRAMPLLRYETTDLAAPLTLPDTTGRGLPSMSAVAGRIQDVISTPDGGLLHPQMFSNVLRQFPGIDWFQLVQERDDALRLRVVARSGLAHNEQDKIAALIGDLSGFRFRLTFELLDDMPKSSTGKFRLCVCDLPSNQQDQSLRKLNQMRATPSSETSKHTGEESDRAAEERGNA